MLILKNSYFFSIFLKLYYSLNSRNYFHDVFFRNVHKINLINEHDDVKDFVLDPLYGKISFSLNSKDYKYIYSYKKIKYLSFLDNSLFAGFAYHKNVKIFKGDLCFYNK